MNAVETSPARRRSRIKIPWQSNLFFPVKFENLEIRTGGIRGCLRERAHGCRELASASVRHGSLLNLDYVFPRRVLPVLSGINHTESMVRVRLLWPEW